MNLTITRLTKPAGLLLRRLVNTGLRRCARHPAAFRRRAEAAVKLSVHLVKCCKHMVSKIKVLADEHLLKLSHGSMALSSALPYL